MPNRKQNIIFSVLGLLALMLGYWTGPICKSTGKRAEAGGPIAPTRELTLEEKNIVGTYESNTDNSTFKFVILENGVVNIYRNVKKDNNDPKWSTVGKEFHIVWNDMARNIYRISPDNNITQIASIRGAIRTDYPNGGQIRTFKRIN